MIKFLIAMVVSVLLSVWMNVSETVINPDAICYLLSAEAVGTSGLSSAMHLCPQAAWPFYSFLIYHFAALTHLSYLWSAYVLDATFSLLTVISFMAIVKQLGGSQRVLWMAALVILLAHEFNSVRQYIVRDHGFWAFYLMSMFILLRFLEKPTWVMGWMWGVSLAVATLFRIEGAIFLLGLPFVVLLGSHFYGDDRARAVPLFLKLNAFIFLCVVIASLGLLFHPSSSLDKWGRIAEVPNQIHYGMIMMLDRYHTMKAALGQYVLTSDSTNDAGLVLALVFVAWYLLSMISNLSWVYTLLVLYAWKRKVVTLTANASLVLAGYLGINVLITVGFLLERSFLSKRYVMALTLVLMLWVPFALNALWQNRANRSYRIVMRVAAFLILFSALGGLFNFGYSKAYLRQAGDWLASNVPEHASLYANDIQLMYYSKHFGATVFAQSRNNSDINTIAHGRWKQYDYLALRVGKKDDRPVWLVKQEITQQPLQVFMNKRGDEVAIYRVK